MGLMAIRYFSTRYQSEYDDGERYIFADPYIRETVEAYDDPRDPGARLSKRESPYAYMQVYHTRSTETSNFDKQGNPINENTTELFTHRPATTQVDLAFSDPSMRHTQPIMGAYLAKKYGELKIGGSLSAHSSKLARNALDRGLPVTPSVSNPNAEQNNTHTFTPMSKVIPRFEEGPEKSAIPGQDVEREIPQYEMTEAKNYLREMLGRKKPLSQQFAAHVEQPKLTGMENF